jgi:hypothetical protein
MQKLPVVSSRKEIEIKTINGQSIFDFYRQIARILKSEYPSETLADMFAEPLLNDIKGEISWLTARSGPIKRLSELSVNERKALAGQMTSASEKIQRLISKLEKSAGSHSSGIVALRNMLISPGLETSLYSVNGAVVLAQWGCIPYGTDPKNFDVIVECERILGNELSTISLQKPIERGPEPNHATTAIISPPDYVPASAAPMEDAEAPSIAQVPPALFPWRFIALAILSLILILGILSFRGFNSQSTLIDQLHYQIDQLWARVGSKVVACFPATALPRPSIITQDDINRRLRSHSVEPGQSVNVSLAWSSRVDLDLEVVEPSGNRINYSQPTSPSGGALDIDANFCDVANRCNYMAAPVENISWKSIAPKGTYLVYVNLFSMNDLALSSAGVDFSIYVTANGETKAFQQSFADADIVCSPKCNSREHKLVYQFEVR